MKTVIIDVDSLRADHVQAYGYGHSTTPRIDEFAEDAILFENTYVANSPCMPSRAGLVSGRYGINNGIETHGPMSQQLDYPAEWESNPWAGGWDGELETPEDWWTLPETIFQDRTMTGAVSSFPRHPAPWFHRSWHEFHYPQEPSGDDESFQTARGEDVTDAAMSFLDRHTESDLFLYAQYWDPHGPYKRTDQEIEEFHGDLQHPYPTAEQISEHRSWETWRSASRMGVSDRDNLEELVAAYDAEIKYVDKQIGRLLDHLRSEEIYDESLIVITGDHGEEFGEHGLYREHWSTHDGTQRVPLLVKPPANRVQENGTRSQLVTNVDIAPTVVDYAGIEKSSKWDGQSLRLLIENEDASGREYVVLDHGLYTAQRAVRTDQWKYVRTYHKGMWDLPEEQLFDMESDPWEQTDVSEDHEDVIDTATTQMESWVEAHTSENNSDTLRTVADVGPAGYQWAKEALMA